jgi:hypothetical protein
MERNALKVIGWRSTGIQMHDVMFAEEEIRRTWPRRRQSTFAISVTTKCARHASTRSWSRRTLAIRFHGNFTWSEAKVLVRGDPRSIPRRRT